MGIRREIDGVEYKDPDNERSIGQTGRGINFSALYSYIQVAQHILIFLTKQYNMNTSRNMLFLRDPFCGIKVVAIIWAMMENLKHNDRGQKLVDTESGSDKNFLASLNLLQSPQASCYS